MQVVIERLEKFQSDDLEKISHWMYEWWGQEEDYTLEKIQERFLHCLCVDKIPQTFVAKINDQIVGIYQFAMQDVDTRPDIYPWLCNVYVDSNYRHLGVGDAMMKTVYQHMQDIHIKELYLYTHHDRFYEKYGWEHIDDIAVNGKMEKLYVLK